MEGLDFIGNFKVESVPGMINRGVLLELYITLHNQLKIY